MAVGLTGARHDARLLESVKTPVSRSALYAAVAAVVAVMMMMMMRLAQPRSQSRLQLLAAGVT